MEMKKYVEAIRDFEQIHKMEEGKIKSSYSEKATKIWQNLPYYFFFENYVKAIHFKINRLSGTTQLEGQPVIWDHFFVKNLEEDEEGMNHCFVVFC